MSLARELRIVRRPVNRPTPIPSICFPIDMQHYKRGSLIPELIAISRQFFGSIKLSFITSGTLLHFDDEKVTAHMPSFSPPMHDHARKTVEACSSSISGRNVFKSLSLKLSSLR